MTYAGVSSGINTSNSGAFVLGSYLGKGLYSTDGITWSSVTLQGSNYNFAYGLGKYVAIDGSSLNKASYSTDGITWTSTTYPTTNSATSFVTYGNGKFVSLANSNGNGQYSLDGITWTSFSAGNTYPWNCIDYGNGVYLALNFGAATVVATSTNGTTWTVRNVPSGYGYFTGSAYGAQGFVAIVQNSATAIRSYDGITWVTTTLPSAAYWISIAYGNGTYVAIHDSGAATSTDGVNWTARTVPDPGSWSAITFGKGLFVMVNQNSGTSSVATSPDGITWTKRTHPSIASNDALISAGFGGASKA